jgi:hypothetical protein
MSLDLYEQYLGAALTKIVEYPQFKALNRAHPERYGHYLVNHSTFLLAKYGNTSASPTATKASWQFTFSPDELAVLKHDLQAANHQVFLLLVCIPKTVCCLNAQEIETLLDLDGPGNQWIRVEWQVRHSLSVHASDGRVLKRKIPTGAFPEKVFLTDNSARRSEVMSYAP